MATYYVSADSVSTNWANAQVIGTPCTVATAMTNAVAGDVVQFLDGTYEPPTASSYEIPSWNPSNSGTVGNRITFKSRTRHGAIIHDCANAAATGHSGFGASSRSYITFDGFQLVCDKQNGQYASSNFVMAYTTGIHVTNCLGIGNEHSYHTNGCILAAHSGNTGIRIYNNIFHGMTADPTPAEAVVNASAIYMFDTTDTEIYNNTIYNCNNGISWKTSPADITCYQNFLYDIGRAAFFPSVEVAGSDGHYIHHNLVLNCGRFVDSEESTSSGVWNTMYVYNNTVYHASALGVVFGSSVSGGLLAGQDSSYQNLRDLRYYNNIISVGATSRIHEIHDDLTSDAMIGTPFDYNCYYASAGTMRFIYNGTSTTTFATYQSAIGAETNSITTTPSFVNAGGTAATDYQLNGGGCVGTGSGGVDMGAWQGVSTMGYQSGADTTPPAVPTGVRVS
jgi:parallel beta-helix repeat protein